MTTNPPTDTTVDKWERATIKEERQCFIDLANMDAVKVGELSPQTIEVLDVLLSHSLQQAREEGKSWYFEGDELVITRGKWVIDRYKKHTRKSDLLTKEEHGKQ